MNKLSAISVSGFLILLGCAGTRLPKLAKCTGPYRYANPYGSVLPSLPIPGQPSPAPGATPAPAPMAPANVPDGAAAAAPSTAPAPAPSAADPSPSSPTSAARVSGKTSALAPYYPSC
jgi:hypothetical protein